MKQSEFTKCAMCAKGMMHDGSPMFYRVSIEPFIINAPAIKRQAGLEMMIGPLAGVMGPDEDMAHPVEGAGHKNVLVCLSCAMAKGIAQAMEAIKTEAEDNMIYGAISDNEDRGGQ